MLLGIEIGGTKLQLGVGLGDGKLVALERLDVDVSRGASGIREQIAEFAPMLAARHRVTAAGIGFGGPVDAASGRVLKSHQVEGWHAFPLVDWAGELLGVPVTIGNDADVAALAEARIGAGRGHDPVFYITVGSGIGGGLVIGGKVYRGAGLGATEIGHLRPGLHADRPEQTVESIASGWGIAANAQARLSGLAHQLRPWPDGLRSPELLRERMLAEEEAQEEYAHDLLMRCDHDVDALTAKMVAQAAAEGNRMADEIWQHACRVLGWAIAQAITLYAPRVVVIGGGVSIAGSKQFFEPVAAAVSEYVFPPFAGKYEILPAQLGEEVVVHGAMAIAGD